MSRLIRDFPVLSQSFGSLQRISAEEGRDVPVELPPPLSSSRKPLQT